MDYIHLCKVLAKAMGSGVRLYCGTELLLYSSHLKLEPDPVLPYVSEMLCRSEPEGIFTTPLCQFYAYFDIANKQRIIIGPSGMPSDDPKQLDTLMFLLDIPPERREHYTQILRSSPTLPLERFVCFLDFLVTTINHRPFSTNNLFLNGTAIPHQREVAKTSAEKSLQIDEEGTAAQIVRGSYAYEKMLLSYIQSGQAEQIREILSGGLGIKAGEMAKDVLRQIKNSGICGATVASRAAITGGLDSNTAFGLSDLYIQKLEVLHDYNSITRLTNDMFIDFAQRVKLAKYCVPSDSHFFKICARYVAEHITEAFSVFEMAEALHISRSYLCTCFKTETGITLSQYILQEKAEEAKRLLQYTDKSLLEISIHLSFSSQSHFQNSFKKATTLTPMEFRRANQ